MSVKVQFLVSKSDNNLRILVHEILWNTIRVPIVLANSESSIAFSDDAFGLETLDVCNVWD